MHVQINGEEPVACCNFGEYGPTLIRHYPNPIRKCRFEGLPSIIEEDHIHSWQCAEQKGWDENWTMKCLECGYDDRNGFFSNVYDIAGCSNEMIISIGGEEVSSPFSSPFYPGSEGQISSREIPLPRMKIIGNDLVISGTDLCMYLELYPNVLSENEEFLFERLFSLLEQNENIELIIDMVQIDKIEKKNERNGIVESKETLLEFEINQQLWADKIQRLKNSKFVKSFIENNVTVKIRTGDKENWDDEQVSSKKKSKKSSSKIKSENSEEGSENNEETPSYNLIDIYNRIRKETLEERENKKHLDNDSDESQPNYDFKKFIEMDFKKLIERQDFDDIREYYRNLANTEISFIGTKEHFSSKKKPSEEE